MFRVQFLVDDKRLGEVLRLVSGKVHDLTQQPVENAQLMNGKVSAIHGGGTIRDAIIPELLKDPEVRRTHRITVDQMKAISEKLGGSAKSVNNIVHTWKKAKRIKSVSRGVYQIIGEK